MREKIFNKRIKGKFIVYDKYIFEDVFCDYSYNIYSNHNMIGSVYLDRISKDLYDDYISNYKCEFQSIYGDYIEGDVKSLPLGRGKIEFKINKINETLYFNEEKANKLTILYLIPFIKPLSRGIKMPLLGDEKILVTFNNDVFKIPFECNIINIKENVNLIEKDKPDFLLNRSIYPEIILNIDDETDNNKIVKYYFKSVNDLFLVISLLLFYRVKSYGYNLYAYRNEKIVYESKYRDSESKSVDDYLNDVGSKFKKYFIGENIEILYNSYKKLDSNKLYKFNRVLYSYISLSELKILEIKFRDTYFLLCAISKLIMDNKKHNRDEELIKESCKIAEIDLAEINFEISPNKFRKPNCICEWLITEYRHELTHYNFIDYDNNKLIIEFEKMIKLLRKLILFYLEPKLKDIPYPENSIWN